MATARGGHTQARTIASALERIREALGAAGEDVEGADLIPHPKLPKGLLDKIRKAVEARERAEKAKAEVQALTREVARKLTQEFGVSVRDAGDLLRLSHQRVQQLLH